MRSKNGAPARQVAKYKELARYVIEHHFGSRPRRIKHKAAGLSNFVFDARHDEGDFIVRISPDKERINAFIKEHWAERAASKEGVPTAEILETGFSVIPFPYMVSRRVEGTEATFHPERFKIVREMGRYAAAINSIRTRGFGETFDWSNNQLSRNKTLGEYLTNEYRYEARLDTLDRSGLCPKNTVSAVRSRFDELKKARVRPVLNHGDLRLKNVIADDSGKITAVIDWEKATSNIAPHWEVSLALHDLGVDEQQHFIEGYGLSAKRLAEISPYVKAFNILNYTAEIDRAREARDKLALDRLRTRFAGTFDLFSLCN